MIGGNFVIFDVHKCDVLYFDNHFHAYVINVTSERSLVYILLDTMVTKLTRISALRYYFCNL